MKEKNNEKIIILDKNRKVSRMIAEKTKEDKPIINILLNKSNNMNTITKYKTNNNNNDNKNNNDVDKKEIEKELFAYDFDKAMAFEHYFPENNFAKIIKRKLIIKKKDKKSFTI